MTLEELSINIVDKSKKISDVLDETIKEIISSKDETKQQLYNKKQTYTSQLKLIEDKLNYENNEYNKNIEQLKKTKEDINVELENIIKEFTSTHQVNAETERLMDLKDTVLVEFIIQTRKERQELNHKITSLEKELSIKVNELEQLKVNEDKVSKAKKQELLKRLKLDFSKTDNNIDLECSDLEQKLLVENEEKKIKQYKKEQKVIRTKGINQKHKLELQYLDDVKTIDLELVNMIEKYNLDIEVVKAEYNIKIEELQYELRKIKNKEDYQDEIYKYNSEKKIFEYVKDNKLALNQIDNEYNEKRYTLEKETLTIDEKRYNVLTSHISNIANEISNKDLAQIQLYKKSYEKQNEYIKKMTTQGEEYITIFIKKTFDWIFEEALDLINLRNEANNELYKSLLMFDYQANNHIDFKYEDYVNEIKQLLDELYSTDIQRLENFKKLIIEEINNLLNQVKNIFIKIDSYRIENQNLQNALQNKLNTIIDNARIKYEDSINQKRFEFTKNINLVNLDYDQKLKEHRLNGTSLIKEATEQCNKDIKEKEITTKLYGKEIIQRNKNEEQKHNENINSINLVVSLATKQNKLRLKNKHTQIINDFNKKVNEVNLKEEEELKLL